MENQLDTIVCSKEVDDIILCLLNNYFYDRLIWDKWDPPRFGNCEQVKKLLMYMFETTIDIRVCSPTLASVKVCMKQYYALDRLIWDERCSIDVVGDLDVIKRYIPHLI